MSMIDSLTPSSRSTSRFQPFFGPGASKTLSAPAMRGSLRYRVLFHPLRSAGGSVWPAGYFWLEA